MEPRNDWQNEKMPPSAATMRYPGPDPQFDRRAELPGLS